IGMLAVSAGGTPGDARRGLPQPLAISCDALSIRLHFELLHIGRQLAKALSVRDMSIRASAACFAIPHLHGCCDRRRILREWHGLEMRIDVGRAREQAIECAILQGNDTSEADARPQ